METVSLDSLAGGAAEERFRLALQDVLNNIMDVNTDAKKERKIILTISIKPDDERSFSALQISVEKKLAPIIPVKTKLYLGKDSKGLAVACEFDPGQTQMFPPPLPTVYKTMKEATA